MRAKIGVAMALSVLAALVLQVAHLPLGAPEWLGWLRPPWMLLIIVFWTLAAPMHTGLVGAWLVGLTIDALNVDPLGLNGALFAATNFATRRFRSRVRMYPLTQQMGAIFLLVLGAEVVCQVVRSLAAEQPFSLMLWVPAVVSALAWPLAYRLLQRMRPQRHIVV